MEHLEEDDASKTHHLFQAMIPDSGDSCCCWKCDMSISLYVEFPPTFLWHPLTIILFRQRSPKRSEAAGIYKSTTFKCQQIFVMKTTIRTPENLQKGIWLHFIPSPPLPGSDLIWNAQANRLFGTGRYREVGGLVPGLHPQISVSAGADMRHILGLQNNSIYNTWEKSKIVTILLQEPSLPSLYVTYNDLYIHTHSYLEFIL